MIISRTIPAILLLLAGCAAIPQDAAPPLPPGDPVARPLPRPDGRTAPETARTVEEFDTTSSAERAKATAPSQGGTPLGITVAGLGNPATPGFWLETPLVETRAFGRVEAPNGTGVKVDLIPIAGPPGAGSRLSLAAIRMLGLPLTGLHELRVFRE